MTRTSSRFTVRGWHVLAGMLGFFVVIIAVNVAFAVVAIGSFPGEDVRRSYLQGLNYNRTLAERREQGALGWRASASLSADGALDVVLRDKADAPVSDATIGGELRWPATAQFDRTLRFENVGGGLYRARLAAPLRAGRWRLRARATGPQDQALDFEADLTWPLR